MAEFAKAQLMKYGWTEGKGLGKNENGITEALRPKLKFDNTGVGHKDDFGNEWWANAYNKAANSITINSRNDAVSISVSKKDKVDALPKEGSKKKKSRLLYGNFMKTCTLYGHNVVDENNSDKLLAEKVESNVVQTPLTDEELFKACGGRTAHKGARHGLSLNGKLDRIAQQEKELLSSSAFTNTMARLKKRERESSDEYEMDSNANTILLSETEKESAPKLSKSVRKMQRRRMNDLSHKLNTLCNMNDNNDKAEHNTSDEELIKKQLKRKKTQNKRIKSKHYNKEDTVEQESCAILLPAIKESKKVSNKSKKVHSKKSVNPWINNEELSDHTSTRNSKKKKSKRKRSQSRQDKIPTAMQVDQEIACVPQSKKPKKQSNKFLAKDEEVPTLQYRRETASSSTETLTESKDQEKYNISDSLHFLKKKGEYSTADRLNYKIKKKKRARHLKKENMRLLKITNSLKAVYFDTEESDKESVVGNLLAENKTKSLKKLARKHNKNQTRKVMK